MPKTHSPILKPEDQKILLRAGLAYESGDNNLAEILSKRIIAKHPKQPDAHYILAVIAAERKDTMAQKLAMDVAPLMPHTAEHQFNLGVLFEKLRDFKSAAVYYTNSLTLRPNDFETLMALGNCELALKNPFSAITLFEKSKAQHSSDPRVWNNLGAAFNEANQLESSEKAYLEGQRLDPASALIQTGLACVYGRMNRPDLALPILEQVVHKAPEYETAHFNYSVLLLISGDFKKGWIEYEWRRKTALWKDDMPTMSQPEWRGEPLQNKTLLIVCEQGIGDTIQFIRFLPNLRAMGANLVIACEPVIRPLLTFVTDPELIIDKDTEAAEYPADYWLPLLSLGLRLQLDCYNIESTNYIHIDEQEILKAAKIIDSLSPGAIRRIGLIWAGNPKHSNDANRSMRLEDLKPLAKLKDTVFFSLQKEGPSNQIKSAPEGMQIVDLEPYLQSLTETAAFILGLDCLVTIDSGMAHLAGALGVATHVLLPAVGTDWRWLLNRTDSPWYPSIRLYRQSQARDWSTPTQSLFNFLSLPPNRNVLVLCENPEDLETQIGLMLLQSVLPASIRLSLGQLSPWKLPDNGPFDLIILGVGTSLSANAFTEPLFQLLQHSPRRIGLFGLEETIEGVQLERILDLLDFWFARTSSDLRQAKGAPHAIYFGDWLVNAFTPRVADSNLFLEAGDEIWKEDAAISKIQAYKNVNALSLSTFLCALHSAESLSYETGQDKTCAALIEDIFGIKTFRGVPINLDRNCLVTYRKERTSMLETFRKILLRLTFQC